MGELTFQNKEDKLLNACRNGDLEDVQRLVDGGADFRVKGDRPARFAATNGHLDVLQYLISKGVDPNSGEDNFLKFAAGAGKLEVVKYLIGKGANPAAQDSGAFIWAAGAGFADVAMYLKGCGANPHAGGDDGFKRAWLNNHRDVCQALIESDPDYYTEMISDYGGMADSDWLQSMIQNQNMTHSGSKARHSGVRVRL